VTIDAKLLLITFCVITKDEGGTYTNDNYVGLLSDLSRLFRHVDFVGTEESQGDGRFYKDGKSLYRRRLDFPNVYPVPIGSGAANLGLLSSVRNLIGKASGFAKQIKQSDFVYITLPVFSGVVAAAICRAVGKPYGVYIAMSWEELLEQDKNASTWKARLYPLRKAVTLWLERFAATGARFVVVHGERSYQKFLPINRDLINVSPMIGITPDMFAFERGPGSAGTDIVFVGTLNARKGVDTLIDALGKAQNEVGRPITCKIVGNGDPIFVDGLSARIEQHGIGDKVQMVGRISSVPDIVAIYRSADILVVPSLAEGFPRVIYEAMSQGCLIVASDIGSISSVLTDGEHCLLVPPGDADALVRAIDRLRSDPALRMHLRENSEAFVRKRITPVSTAQQLASKVQEYLG
jgi:glycosyltransferase involved in cell wall biosynthesis